MSGSDPILTSYRQAEQKAAAKVLLQAVRKGLRAAPGFEAMDARQQECDVVVCAVRRVASQAVDHAESTRPEVLAVALAAALGVIVGDLLKGAPADVRQNALEANTLNIISAMGADPTRPAATLQTGSGLEDLH